MNLLGIDVGTTGCKVALFSPTGEMGAAAYRAYETQNPQQIHDASFVTTS